MIYINIITLWVDRSRGKMARAAEFHSPYEYFLGAVICPSTGTRSGCLWPLTSRVHWVTRAPTLVLSTINRAGDDGKAHRQPVYGNGRRLPALRAVGGWGPQSEKPCRTSFSEPRPHDDFLKPMGVSQNAPARAVRVPPSRRINEVKPLIVVVAALLGTGMAGEAVALRLDLRALPNG